MSFALLKLSFGRRMDAYVSFKVSPLWPPWLMWPTWTLCRGRRKVAYWGGTWTQLTLDLSADDLRLASIADGIDANVMKPCDEASSEGELTSTPSGGSKLAVSKSSNGGGGMNGSSPEAS